MVRREVRTQGMICQLLCVSRNLWRSQCKVLNILLILFRLDRFEKDRTGLLVW